MSLLERLQQLNRRLRRIQLAAGLGWGLVAAVVLLLAAAWLDLLWEMSPELRVAALASAVAVLLVLVGAAAWLARRLGQPTFLSARLDDAAGTQGQIRAGVDLALAAPPAPALSAGLADMAIARAASLAEPVPAARVVPARPVQHAGAAIISIVAMLTLVAQALPRLAEAQWLRFSDPFGDHPPYSRVVYRVVPGDVAVVYGGSVEIRVTTEGALVERLELVLEGPGTAVPGLSTLPMFPSGDGEWYTTIASVVAPGRYHVRSHAGRSARFRLDVITVPRLEEVVFRVTPPAYTNRPAQEGPLPQGGLAGLTGTQVDVRVRSNRPLAGGTLQLDGDALPLSARGGLEATGSFTIRRSGKLLLSVKDTDGQASTENFPAPITLLSDQRPHIRLVEPPPLSFATPDVTLPVVLSAEDDYGLTQVHLFRSLNDSRALPLAWSLPAPAPLRWTTTALLPLSSYGLTPGDEIKLFARAEDNDPSGPNGAETAIVVVRIISQEDYEKMVRAREGLEALLSRYRQARRRTEGLADEVERLQKKKRGDDAKALKEAANDLDELAKRLDSEAEAIRKAAERALPYDIDEALRKHLERTARRLEDMARTTRRLSGTSLSRAALDKALEEMLKELQEQQQQLERETIEPLEHLALIFPLLEDAARFTDLYQRQKGLAERLQSLKGREQPAEAAVQSRLRDLKAEQEQLRAALGRLLDDIEDHAAALPEEQQLEELRKEALDFVRNVRGSSADEAMTKAERGLGELSGTRGHAGAQEAADILERFVKRLEDKGGLPQGGKMCLRFQPVLAKSLGATVAQLLADMGLAPNGEGNLGGQSTQRSTLENLGLYGNLPTDAGGRDAKESGSRARATNSRNAVGSAPGQSAGANGRGPGEAEGAGEAAVPLSYRRRVAEYFQRIADETGR